MSVRFARRFWSAVALILLAISAIGVPGGRVEAAGLKAKKSTAGKASKQAKAFLYAAVGPELRQYELDIASATLTEKSSVMLPADIQAAWAHPSSRYLYVAWSNGGANSSGTQNGLSAFRVDPATGAVQALGQPAMLPSRPIYVSTDIPGTHVLVAYTVPSGITVHRIAADGSIGEQVKPQEPLEFGIYGHQILIDPSNTMAILVARGNVPSSTKKEDPGALKIFRYQDGSLANVLTIAPDGGFGFHPRYLDFHPSRPWIYVSLSQQNQLGVYEKQKDGTLKTTQLFVKDTLADPAHVRPGQLTGALHIHPSGKFVYIANRATSSVNVEGKPVFAGGENSIGVFEINLSTGEPTLIQNADTKGIGPVEFALDPSGSVLVLANLTRSSVRDDAAGIRTVLPSLALFRVGSDGKLDYARKYEFDVNSGSLFWIGITPLPE